MTTSVATVAPAATAYLPAIRADSDSDKPLYRQIYEWFREAILGGQLLPGQAIPSTRSLASHLQVSRAPVLVAFELLLAEGYFESRTGAGTRVSASLPTQMDRGQPDTNGAARSLRPRTVGGPPVIPVWNRGDPWWGISGAFSVGVPDTRRFPIGVWTSMLARHARNCGSRTLGSMGHLPLRAAIVEYLQVARGVRCVPEQVMIINGAQQGMHLAARVLLGSGDSVWMEEPGYWGARGALRSTGAELVPVPVDAEGLNIDEGVRRKSDARMAYVTPAHQFPMGCTMTVARRLRLLDWAARNDAWILEDDYDSEFRFEGQPISSLQGLDTEDRVIYIGTFSKIVAPGMRIGYIVIPMDLVPAFQGARQAIDLGSPTLIQLVLTEFMQSGHFARYVRGLRQVYAGRHAALISAVEKYVGESLRIVGSADGLHVLGLLLAGVVDVDIAHNLAKAGISAVPLSSCFLARAQKTGLILGYANTDADELEKAAKVLGAVLREAVSASIRT